MIDETDLSEELSWFYKVRAERVAAKLRQKYINAIFTPSRQGALTAILSLIPEGVKVARGDSISVDQVGIIDELKKRSRNEVVDPFARNAEGQTILRGKDRFEAQRKAFFTDVFITGANAITLDGKIVSTDAVGNRVAPVIFGPTKVILVIGANKIVDDLDSALKRIREIAAPVNAKRHALKHHVPEFGKLPCAVTGICADCNSDWRICHYTIIIEGSMLSQKDRINVILVGEELGI